MLTKTTDLFLFLYQDAAFVQQMKVNHDRLEHIRDVCQRYMMEEPDFR